MANQNKCFWANEDIPRGKYYEIGERVPEASNPGMCRMACVCTEGYGGGAEIICASPGKKTDLTKIRVQVQRILDNRTRPDFEPSMFR
jgi:hypothetical protein